MGQSYVGEIRMFGGNFAPAGWDFCDGRLLPISENDTLFQLIGTTYGGDGVSTFGLPDLQGRVPLHAGQGTGGLQNYTLGETGGVESVTVTTQQTPTHNHAFLASASGATSPNPENNTIGSPPTLTMFIVDNPVTPLSNQAVTGVGGSQSHENRMPMLAVSFIISLFGVYPQQT
ncbi:MAG TPA: tail fiber protein [Thermoleophilaceae bacterium]|nr:tail fiber protein [Thermoleophilaceae bacterium]